MLTKEQQVIRKLSEVFLCCSVLAMVMVFALMTAARLSILPPHALPGIISAPSASAATWEERNGRIYTYCGGGSWCFDCDQNYGLVANHHEAANGGNDYDSIWFSCAAGPW